ncbi:hypothetical protein [Kaarinaea lacus]
MSKPIAINNLTELDRLALTCEALDISEFEIFRRAYSAWYGDAPTVAQLDTDFDDHLREGVPPFYVRHYCRQYIEQRPETVDAAIIRERRSRFAERLVTGLLVAFVAGALILA